MERNTIFISHATPEDNPFATWLALRLMSLGYAVWCDAFNLSKGGDFWVEIENQIRQNTCKFLLVQSLVSNGRDGVLKEIAVAQKVKKQTGDPNFIMPLLIDSKLSFDEINVDVIRLNSIDFTSSWADGLASLVKALEEQKCAKAGGRDLGNAHLFRSIVSKDRLVVRQTEVLDTNWYPIGGLPSVLYFYSTKHRSDQAFGSRRLFYKNHLVSFVDRSKMSPEELDLIAQDGSPITYNIPDFLKKQSDDDFIKVSTFRNLMSALLGKAFDRSIAAHPGVCDKTMSVGAAFWYPHGALENDKVGRISLVGSHKQYKWHFAISGTVKMFPLPLVQIRSHVLFSKDGHSLLPSDSAQHSARRSVGRNWWNRVWRNRVRAFVNSLVDGETGKVLINVGLPTPIRMDAEPIMFESPVSYVDPGAIDENDFDCYPDDDCDLEGA